MLDSDGLLQYAQQAETELSTMQLDELAEDQEIEALLHDVRATEFPQLQDTTFLDHAGSTLASKTQLDAHMNDIQHTLYSNPHSQNPSSVRTTEAIERVRERVLRFFNTTSSTHTLVFTSGATGGMSILANSFPWEGAQCKSCLGERKETSCGNTASFTYLNSNHTSVVGVRGMAEHSGARISTLTANEMQRLATESMTRTDERPSKACTSRRRTRHCLFAYPAQCNFSGTRYPLEWVDCVQSGDLNGKLDTRRQHLTKPTTPQGTRPPVCDCMAETVDTKWHVLLDTSAYVSCAELDLTAVRADFVTVSFYKMFGYPTGLGALIIRNDALTDSGGGCECGCAAASDGQSNVPPQVSSVNNGDALQKLVKPIRVKEHTNAQVGPHTPAATGNALKSMHVKSPLGWLNKKYYGGGTLALSDNSSGTRAFASNLATALEDGTVSYLSILALNNGLDALQRVGGMRVISRHTHTVAHWLYYQMSQLRHPRTQTPVCLLYTSPDRWELTTETRIDTQQSTHATQISPKKRLSTGRQGPVVTMNLLAADGSAIGYAHVAQLAALEKIHVRTGCLCNTGACHDSLGLDLQDVLSNYRSGHTCGDGMDILNGRPTGALRVSCGYMSTLQDVKGFLGFVYKYFVEERSDVRLPSKSVLVGETTAEEIYGVEVRETQTQEKECNTNDQGKETTQHEQQVSRETGQQPTVAADATDSLTWDAEMLTQSPSEQCNAETHAPLASTHPDTPLGTCEATLTHVYVYPIKSCGAMVVPQGRTWAMTAQGLAFDRMWMVVDALTNKPLTMKTHDSMCLIKPTLDLYDTSEDGMDDSAGIGLAVQETTAGPGTGETDASVGAEVVSDFKGVTVKGNCAPRARALRLNAPGMREIAIPLDGLDGINGQTSTHAHPQTQTVTQDCPHITGTTVRVCNRRVLGVRETSDDVHAWLTETLGVPCMLVRCAKASKSGNGRTTTTASQGIGMTSQGNDGKNDSPFLVVNADSVREIDRVATQMLSTTAALPCTATDYTPSRTVDIQALQFRPNFVVKTDIESEPFVEDRWTHLSFPARETTSLAVRKECVRCQLVCVDPRTGERSKVPLQALGLCRQKKLTFGMYLNLISEVRLPRHPHIVVCAECFEDKVEQTRAAAVAMHHHSHTCSYMSKLVPAGEETHVRYICPGDVVHIRIKAVEEPKERNDADHSESEWDTASSQSSSDDEYDSVIVSAGQPTTGVAVSTSKACTYLAASTNERHTVDEKRQERRNEGENMCMNDSTRGMDQEIVQGMPTVANAAQTTPVTITDRGKGEVSGSEDSSEGVSENVTYLDTDSDTYSDEDSDLSKDYYDDDG
ncbi:hypothetical protein SARC_01307 [Sphaeroforma arctica JP610]|uniref:Molybdenum cofactor sulfurase n=1 Tax=Sphaeroforma arctica JP610 TaxID=667725 RepID=A0A0L0GC97_9EUKA|nr:hypothetical protein SARC_01307 [Sphaeroforma arctica JP610]KNC86534.1 hypothetical protein SARC_01307 [Sphaeroforma arctica JP610]|eukprot:XP_014160436.1 hypothetical protein SARC_01307 [Sphaeroforma arctica JP610]